MASDLGRIFRQLVTLAEYGNYRKAAQRLGITHSALSQAVSRLEASYGVPLFERNGRRTEPTVFGQRLVEAARISLAALEEAEHDIARWRAQAAGELRITAAPCLAGGPLARAAAVALAENGHDRRLAIEPKSRQEALRALGAGLLDLHVDYQPQTLPDGFVAEPLPLPPLEAFVRPEHPLAEGAAPVPLARLLDGPVMMPQGPAWLHRRLMDALGEDGETIRDRILPITDAGFMLHLLELHDIVALVPRTTVAAALASGRLVGIEIADSPFAAPLPGVVFHDGKTEMHPVARRILALIREEATAAAS